MEKLLKFLLLSSIVIASSSGNEEPKLEITEDEILKDDDWIMVLHCKLYHKPADKTDQCSEMKWTYESEDNIVKPVTNDTDYYHVQNNIENMTSTLELLTSDSTEELYTCIVLCDSRTFRINCWIGELQNKERSSVCSKRIFNNVISATEISPGDEDLNEKSEELKIGVSVVCMLVVGMALTVIIRCRLKRQDALKHARAVLENANQCLLEARNRPPFEYPDTTRSSASLISDTPIYRPVSQRSDRSSRPHRNLERLYQESSAARAYRNRLILQEMSDGSQLIFVPGSKLPTYEDSQNSNHRLSMETFQQPQPSCGTDSERNPFGFLINNRDLMQNSENGQLSSPPSYTSMTPNETEGENTSGDLSSSESISGGLCMSSKQSTSDFNTSLLEADSRYQPTPLVSCTSRNDNVDNNFNSALRNTQSVPPFDSTDFSKYNNL